MKLICPICSKKYEKSTGHYNRAIKLGAKLYCSRICFSAGRKLEFDKHLKTPEQLKAEKAEYDKKYRYYYKEGIKAKKAEAFKKDYANNPEKYRAERKRRAKEHAEYCRTPEYKAWKVEYDKKNRALKNYGEYAEAFLLTQEISSLIDNREIKKQQGLINKKQTRERLWKNLMQNR